MDPMEEYLKALLRSERPMGEITHNPVAERRNALDKLMRGGGAEVLQGGPSNRFGAEISAPGGDMAPPSDSYSLPAGAFVEMPPLPTRSPVPDSEYFGSIAPGGPGIAPGVPGATAGGSGLSIEDLLDSWTPRSNRLGF